MQQRNAPGCENFAHGCAKFSPHEMSMFAFWIGTDIVTNNFVIKTDTFSKRLTGII